MASILAPGHSEEIMVAQPVDTITAAPALSIDAMAHGVGSGAKETENIDMSSDLDLSVSPIKDLPDVPLDRGRTPFDAHRDPHLVHE